MKYLVLFTLFAMNLVDQPAPEVTIDQGVLSGKISADGTFYEYLGIPYATVVKRFQAPGPPSPWNGVYKAIDDIYKCPQATSFGVIGMEDCLKANVYVPALANKLLPVMVWIHGGGFMIGSDSKLVYGPDFIVRKDVILVTFNYRLGALGFLCLGIQEAPGNAGIKDQLAALRWVKRNIAAFGGDPDYITLFGESAGSVSASFLLASKKTEGLFNKVIMQSGSSLANFALNLRPVWIASLLARQLGYDTNDAKELYNIFSNLNYRDLSAINFKKPLDLFLDTRLLHLPCIEENIEGVESVITDLPYNMITETPKDIPMIFGSNSREGLYLVSMETEKTVAERNERYYFASDLRFPFKNVSDILDKKIKKFYFGEDKISIDKLMNVSDLYTHLNFESPAIMESELYVNRIESRVYNYYFNYSGSRNFVKLFSGFRRESGACHADDLAYLFNQIFLPLKVSYEDAKIIDYMTTMWTNFAKYGNPTPEPNDLQVVWKPSTREKLNFLYIDENIRMGEVPNLTAYRMWKDIYTRYRLRNV